MHRFLTLKHWQLFPMMVLPACWLAEPWKFFVLGITVVIFSSWIYAIGMYGQEKLGKSGMARKPTGLFKLNCALVPVFYFLLVLGYEPVAEGDWAEYFFLPVTVYFCLAALQITLFSVKTLTVLETGKEPKFGGWILNFILVLLAFVGVWILQPKINALIGTKN